MSIITYKALEGSYNYFKKLMASGTAGQFTWFFAGRNTYSRDIKITGGLHLAYVSR